MLCSSYSYFGSANACVKGMELTVCRQVVVVSGKMLIMVDTPIIVSWTALTE